MPLNIAVAGYGNLGKAIEKLAIADERFVLTKIYSRRKIDNPLRAPFAAARSAEHDVVLLAMGSKNDIDNNLEQFCAFNTVDCYDDHANAHGHMELLKSIKDKRTVSVACAGWDPGIMSAERALLNLVGNPVTLWGRGISMGHTNAVRDIAGVLDAVQITAPKLNAKQLAQKGAQHPEALHDRIVYVACADCDKQRIRQEIINMPHYFAEYDTEVLFCSQQEIRQIKAKDTHRGQTIVYADGCTASFTLDMQSNSLLTAKIMLEYAAIIPQLQRDGMRGVLTPLDVPLKYLVKQNVL